MEVLLGILGLTVIGLIILVGQKYSEISDLRCSKSRLESKTESLERSNKQANKYFHEERQKRIDLKDRLKHEIIAHTTLMEYSESEFSRLEVRLGDMSNLLKSRSQAHTWIKTALADIEYLQAERAALMLEGKSHPAKKAADDVRKFGQHNKILKSENKELSNRLNAILEFFPGWKTLMRQHSMNLKAKPLKQERKMTNTLMIRSENILQKKSSKTSLQQNVTNWH